MNIYINVIKDGRLNLKAPAFATEKMLKDKDINNTEWTGYSLDDGENVTINGSVIIQIL